MLRVAIAALALSGCFMPRYETKSVTTTRVEVTRVQPDAAPGAAWVVIRRSATTSRYLVAEDQDKYGPTGTGSAKLVGRDTSQGDVVWLCERTNAGAAPRCVRPIFGEAVAAPQAK